MTGMYRVKRTAKQSYSFFNHKTFLGNFFIFSKKNKNFFSKKVTCKFFRQPEKKTSFYKLFNVTFLHELNTVTIKQLALQTQTYFKHAYKLNKIHSQVNHDNRFFEI